MTFNIAHNKLSIHYRSLISVFFCLIFILGLCTNLFAGAADPLVKKAKDHLNLFHYEKARAILKQATSVEPENWEPYYLIGKSLWKEKKHYEAEKFLVKAYELNPNELDCQKALGAVYIFLAKEAQKAGNRQKMVEYLHKSCKSYPTSTKMWLTLFENWRNDGAYDKIKAEGDFLVKKNKRALEAGDDKSLQSALVIVAQAFFKSGNYGEADSFLKHASRIRQANDDLYNMKRDLKNLAEDKSKKLFEEAQLDFSKKLYLSAIKKLEEAKSHSNYRSSEIQDLLEKSKLEMNIATVLKKVEDAVSQKNYEVALEELGKAASNYPEDTRISKKIEEVNSVYQAIVKDKEEREAKLLAIKRKRMKAEKDLKYYSGLATENEEKKQYTLAISNLKKAMEFTSDKANFEKKISELEILEAEEERKQKEFSEKFSNLEELFAAQNYEKAYETGKPLLQDYPEKKSRISPIVAESALNLGHLDEAKNLAIDFENEKDQQDLYFYVTGMIFYKNGDFDQAMESLKKMNDKTPGFRSDAASAIRYMYLYKFQIGIYIILLMLAFPIYKYIRSFVSNYKQSMILRKVEKIKEDGTYSENLQFLQERFEKEDVPNPKQINIMYAEALFRTENYQRAYELALNIIKRDPRNTTVKRIIGESCIKLGDTSPIAIENIQALFKLDESRTDIVEFLARTYMNLKADHKLAQDFISRFLQQNPTDTNSLLYLADIIISRENYTQDSYKTLERACRAAPEIPEYLAGLIANYKKLGMESEHSKALEMARQKFPDEPLFQDKPAGIRASMNSNVGGGFPDYENIGNDEYDQQPGQTNNSSNPGGFPDYENIGNESYPANPGGFPDYENIGNSAPPIPTPPAPPAQSQSPGAKTVPCPHCSSQVPISEYYCSSCGKPMAG